MKNNLIDRWHNALKKIGTQNLLGLPEQVKEVLMNCNDLEIKVKILELIVKEMEISKQN